ncbi:MAG: hypothetical protein KGJ84_10265 [Elusimicrobia bacterium]|nr:hypothetical protein [Elusimicrobiota bacterium]
MRSLVAAILLLSAGCATLGPPEPTSVSHGLLVMQGKVRGAVIPFTSDLPDRALIEQLDDNGEPIPGRVLTSNLAREGRVYFLDLPAGRYALTELSFRARGSRYEVILSSAVMRKAVVELRPGKAAFLGSLLLDGRYPDFDVAVERALAVVVHWATFFLPRPVIPRDADLRAHDQGPMAEQTVLFDARKDLDGMQWLLPVENRLRELGAPEPAAMSGTLRPRRIPLQDERYFSWRDTLKWGPPQRAEPGLAWRRPGGEARIAVFFTSSTAPGFEGFDAAVRQMRADADHLDDPAAVYEVRVGTRTGLGARLTTHRYTPGTLVGSEERVTVTETVLVRDPMGMFTARLRAPHDEFAKVLPAFREFLLQLSLGPRVKAPPKEDPILPL